jgi:hypothetical protein
VADDLLRALPSYEIRALSLVDGARPLLHRLLREWGLQTGLVRSGDQHDPLLFSFIGAMLALEVV